jgi:KDO2-lipid IV(A) lauroyltransferase
LEYLLFQVLVCVIDCLPSHLVERSSKTLAWLIHYGLPRKWTRYRIAYENVQRAFGDSYSDVEIDTLIYRMWIHLFRTVAEIVQAPRKVHLHTYRRVVEFADFTRTNQAICSGRRVLMLGGHFGNWEVGTALFGIWGFPMGSLPEKWTIRTCMNGFADSGNSVAIA